MFHYRVVMVLSAFLAIAGCQETIGDGDGYRPGDRGVFIVNEGNFGSGTGDISYFDLQTDHMSNGLFLDANGDPAGDVVQDFLTYDTVGIIVVNNSNVLRVVRLSDFTNLADIPVSQPRYIAEGPFHYAYITTWDNDVKVVDLQTWQVIDSIVVGSYPEDVVVTNGLAFIANSGFGYSNTLSVINTQSGTVESEIVVGFAPMQLQMSDDTTRMFVACAGNPYAQPKVPGGVFVVDIASRAVVDSMVTDTIYPTKLSIRGTRGFIISGYSGPILCFDTSTLSVTDTIDGNFYGVASNAFDDLDTRIYATTAGLFGKFHIYEEDGFLVRDLPVGQFPSGVVFQYRH